MISSRQEKKRDRQMAAVTSERGGLGVLWSWLKSAKRHGKRKWPGTRQESTHSDEIALLVGLANVEESMDEHKVEDGRHPGVGLGHRAVSAQGEELVKSPVSAVLRDLGIDAMDTESVSPPLPNDV